MNPKTMILFNQNHKITDEFVSLEFIVVYSGDCLDLLRSIPDKSMQLIVTSPPYNYRQRIREEAST